MRTATLSSILLAYLSLTVSAAFAAEPKPSRFDSLLRSAPLTGEEVAISASRIISIPSGAQYSMSDLALNGTDLLQVAGTLELGRLTIAKDAAPSIECTGTLTVFGDLIINNGVILSLEGTVSVLGSIVSGDNAGLVLRSGSMLKVYGNLTGSAAANVMGGGALSVKGIRSADSIGFKAMGPRPSDLISFSTEFNSGTVTLKWTSKVNICSKEFLVQKSPDGILYVDLFSVPANIRGSAVGNYSVVDEEPYSGTSFYRLKQSCDTSFLGFSALTTGYSYSPFKGMTFYANPVLKQLEIYFPGQFNNIVARLEDKDGTVQPCSIDFLPPFFSIATGNIPTGIYYIAIEADGKTERRAVSIVN